MLSALIEPFVKALIKDKHYDILSSLYFINKGFNKCIKKAYLSIILVGFKDRYNKLKYLNCSFDISFEITHLNYKNIVGLDLRNNKFIKDISMLTNLTSLNLGLNNYITDISMLHNLKELSLYCNGKIKKIDILTNLTSLNLCGNGMINDISMLTNIVNLELDKRNIIQSIIILPGNKTNLI